ncbi:peptidase U32 family protein [Virgibacillus byunsanensis]|uniref:Peptidase U32 family protein n=1 Tax=Virgibacillus byunsanensis TaxID=570945 RepID=A0ABW3LQT4_9BACI
MELIATAESVNQAKALIHAGIDTLYIGNDEFGLRLPSSFSQEEIKEITIYAHLHHKKVTVAVNGLMHNDRIEKVVPYLNFLQRTGIDSITVGDPGVIHLLQSNHIDLAYVYDAQTLVTSAKHINFWAKRGAKGAVLARELTFVELKAIQTQVLVPTELLVYGATCIHHSKRPLVENYYNFTEQKDPATKDLFISEPKKPNTHYSIYEDRNGTHVFNTKDINLLPYAGDLVEAGLTQWKLDGVLTRGDRFVEIASLFVEAKQAFVEGSWSEQLMEQLNEQLIVTHPQERSLNEGFFLKDPNDVQ